MTDNTATDSEKINLLWKKFNTATNVNQNSDEFGGELLQFKNTFSVDNLLNKSVPNVIHVTQEQLNNTDLSGYIQHSGVTFLTIKKLDNFFEFKNYPFGYSLDLSFLNLPLKYYYRQVLKTVNGTSNLYSFSAVDPSNIVEGELASKINSNDAVSIMNNIISWSKDLALNSLTYQYKLYYTMDQYNVTSISYNVFDIPMFSNPTYWILDNKNGIIQFYGGKKIANGNNIELNINNEGIEGGITTYTNWTSASTPNKSPPFFSYMRYVGPTGFNNVEMTGLINIDGSLNINNDLSFSDISNNLYNVLNTKQIKEYINSINLLNNSDISFLSLDAFELSYNDLSNLYASKSELNLLESSLNNYVTRTDIDASFALYSKTTDIDASFAFYTPSIDIYTKTELQSGNLDLSFQNVDLSGSLKVDGNLECGTNTTASGTDSVAFGVNTYASGYQSTAFGASSTASGIRSTAFGWSTEASNTDSTAFGYDSTASGIQSTAFGDNTIASGKSSLAFGHNTEATSFNCNAFGFNTTASNNDATAFGHTTTASNNQSTAFGNGTTASGDQSTAFGSSTTASSGQSTAFGYSTNASGLRSTAFGRNTTASDNESTAFGHTTTASGLNSTAFGNGTHASGNYSLAFGQDTTASGNYSLAFGYNTTASSVRSSAFGEDTTASATRSTAFGFGTTASGNESTAFGYNTTASGNQSTAFGTSTTASAIRSTAFGWSTEASNTDSTAFGYNTTASGVRSTAFGHKTNALGNYSTAFGRDTSAINTDDIAFGWGNVASGTYSTAFGWGTRAYGKISTSFGRSTHANALYSTACGAYTTASGESSFACGYYTNASGENSFVCGQYNEPDENKIFIIGYGDDSTNRKNAITVDYSGNVDISGTLKINQEIVATKNYIDSSFTQKTVFDDLSGLHYILNAQVQTICGSNFALDINEISGNILLIEDNITTISGRIENIKNTVNSLDISYVTDIAFELSYNDLSNLYASKSELNLLESSLNNYVTRTDIDASFAQYTPSTDIYTKTELQSGNLDLSFQNVDLSGKLVFTVSDTSYITIKAPDILDTNYTLTLPTSLNSENSGNVLTTDGSGNLSWRVGVTGTTKIVPGVAAFIYVSNIENVGGNRVITVDNSYNMNISSDGSGIFTCTFENKMPNNKYIILGQIIEDISNDFNILIDVEKESQTDFSFNILITRGDNGSDADVLTDRGFYITVFHDTYDGGDLKVGGNLECGENTSASNYSAAFGNNTTASGINSFAFGYSTTASGVRSTAFGRNTTASDNESTAFGLGTTASGNQSTAFGSSTHANALYSTAFGYNTIADASNSTACGVYTTASGENSFVCGQYNEPDKNKLFIIGCGDDSTNQKNAVTVDYSGNVDLTGYLKVDGSNVAIREEVDASFALYSKTADIDASFALYSKTTSIDASFALYSKTTDIDASFALYSKTTSIDASFAQYTPSTNIYTKTELQSGNLDLSFQNVHLSGSLKVDGNLECGTNTTASGTDSFAFGNTTTASGDQSTAFGYNTTASGVRSTAFGHTTTASKNHSTAFGYNTIASEWQATAFGWSTSATNNSSTAFGRSTTASGPQSTAFGNSTIASGTRSAACGYYTNASGENSFVCGQYNEPDENKIFIIGCGDVSTNRINAVTVDYSGNLGINTIQSINENSNGLGDIDVSINSNGSNYSLIVDAKDMLYGTKYFNYDISHSLIIDDLSMSNFKNNAQLVIYCDNSNTNITSTITFRGSNNGGITNAKINFADNITLSDTDSLITLTRINNQNFLSVSEFK